MLVELLRFPLLMLVVVELVALVVELLRVVVHVIYILVRQACLLRLGYWLFDNSVVKCSLNWDSRIELFIILEVFSVVTN